MVLIRTEARHGLRWVLFGFVSVLLALESVPALAAPYSDIVVDANSGNVLHATNPDARRHPASLTKIMTLYLLFEQLEAGKLKLDSPLKISEHAAGQSPTKLGLKAGSTILAEDAIKGIVTRSANDAAVVVAEAISGDEHEFAKLMTRKAQALGMAHTLYKNASGLPDDEQVTTARDQSILGRAIQERFPRHYKYFSTRSFNFRGQRIGNHNNLLGRVEGVDGIKTGYIRASGFNLVTSVHRGNRYVVAVVLGGSSAGSRDARMRELISKQITVAATKRTAPLVAESTHLETKAVLAANAEAKSSAADEVQNERRSEAKPATPESKPETRFAVASSTSKPARLVSAATELSTARENASPAAAQLPVALGSTDPIRPVLVKTLAVRAGRAQAPAPAPLLPVQVAAFAEEEPEQVPPAPARSAPGAIKSENQGEGGGARLTVAEAAQPAEPATAAAAPPRPAAATTPAIAVSQASSVPNAATRSSSKSKPQVRTGWGIQVGAYHAEEEAKQRLSRVQSKASKMLDGADPFTETVDKGGTTYYRARFAGLDKEKAEAACKYLKRNDVECVTMKY
jgi:D-alanyl-D-alanine carboxypeptidase